MACLFLAVESLVAGNGGICTVARLMARVLAEEVQAGRLCVDALVLSDGQAPCGLGLPLALARGHRGKFLWRTHVAAFNHSHVLYDFLGMARAHSRLPLLDRPFLTWIHGVEVWEHARSDRLVWARRANVLLSNSAYTCERARRLHKNFPPATVCWLATESDEVSPPQPKVEGPPTVTLIGRLVLDRPKGHRELIDCWHKVVAAVPDARLLMVGRGRSRDYFENLAAQSPARSQIQFSGFVPREQLESVWAQTSVLAMPSRGEGFGLVYIEAMQHGIPIVASVHDAAPEINIDGVTGFNVNLDRPDELPDRLIFLLKNPDRAADLGRAGRKRWASHFHYACFRERFRPILTEFLRSDRSP